MGKVLNIDIGKCTGCRACELACSMKHYGEYNPSKSMIRVSIFVKEAYAVPLTCLQCKDAECKNVCPFDAITTIIDARSGARIVKIDEDECRGCKMCVKACPMGNILLTDEERVGKCDLCDGDPECVKFCLAGALKFEEPEIGMMNKRRALSEVILATYLSTKK